jgi:hypothetical protein
MNQNSKVCLGLPGISRSRRLGWRSNRHSILVMNSTARDTLADLLMSSLSCPVEHLRHVARRAIQSIEFSENLRTALLSSVTPIRKASCYGKRLNS